MNFAYFILIPAIIVWLPFFLVQLITGMICFCLGVKWVFSKLYIVADVLTNKLNHLLNNEKYLKFAGTVSYILLGIMVIARVLVKLIDCWYHKISGWFKNILFVSYLKNKGVRRLCFMRV